jgi:hypothetical protein
MCKGLRNSPTYSQRVGGHAMEFSLSTEQRELKEAAAAFARATLNQDLAEPAEPGAFPQAAWQACAWFGIQA